MIDDEIIKSLKKRYRNINPLVFHRSLEKSDNATDLFDILESVPSVPFFWDDSSKKWSKTNDFYLIDKVKNII